MKLLLFFPVMNDPKKKLVPSLVKEIITKNPLTTSKIRATKRNPSKTTVTAKNNLQTQFLCSLDSKKLPFLIDTKKA